MCPNHALVPRPSSPNQLKQCAHLHPFALLISTKYIIFNVLVAVAVYHISERRLQSFQVCFHDQPFFELYFHNGFLTIFMRFLLMLVLFEVVIFVTKSVNL